MKSVKQKKERPANKMDIDIVAKIDAYVDASVANGYINTDDILKKSGYSNEDIGKIFKISENKEVELVNPNELLNNNR